MKTKLYSLSSLIAPFITTVKETKASKKQGICTFCAQDRMGYDGIEMMGELKFFTRYQDMELYGGLVCYDCYNVLRCQKTRSRHWIASKNEWQFLKREEIIPVILGYPNPPWALYVTESHKKHGWIRGMYAINYGNNSSINIIHEEFILETTISEIERMSGLVKELLDAGFTKGQIKGNWSPTSLNKIMEKGLYHVYLEVKQFQDTPFLHVVTYLS